jgi:hypothetical protein
VKEINLTQGFKTLVDDADFVFLSQYTWRIKRDSHTNYAQTSVSTGLKKPRQVMLSIHRLIMDAQPGQQVDHKNGNGLDNRRENLRICSQKENVRNRHSTVGKSKYKGVSWNTAKGKWKVTIFPDYQQVFLGYFDDEDEAAKIYDEAAQEYYGEFAKLNFDSLGKE